MNILIHILKVNSIQINVSLKAEIVSFIADS